MYGGPEVDFGHGKGTVRGAVLMPVRFSWMCGIEARDVNQIYSHQINTHIHTHTQTTNKVLWVDNMDDSEGLLDEFREWFADPTTKKVWHNYGFDRHVLFNHGVDCMVSEGYYNLCIRRKYRCFVSRVGWLVRCVYFFLK